MCRRVLHCVAIVPPWEAGRASSSSESSEGRRKDCTWPLERPTATTGAEGWMAWQKRSAERGSWQRFSYLCAIVAVCCVVDRQTDGWLCGRKRWARGA